MAVETSDLFPKLAVRSQTNLNRDYDAFAFWWCLHLCDGTAKYTRCQKQSLLVVM
jgi:hypothetical protein